MDIYVIFVLTGAIITIGFFANYFFKKTKIPDVLWLVFLGFLIGPVFKIINPKTVAALLPLFSALALMLILFDSGSRIDIYRLVRESPHALVLTLLSFLLSFSFVSIFLLYAAGLKLVHALILSAIISGSSSAIVSPLIELLKSLRKDISLILKLESILTDPLVIIVALVLLRASSISLIDPRELFIDVLHMFSTSLVLGFAAGIFWGFIWHKFEKFEFHYMLTLAFLFFMFVASDLSGGNGAISVFFIGLVLGNMRKIRQMLRLKHVFKGLSKDLKQLNSYITFFIKTFFFTTIGMSTEIYELKPVYTAFAIALVLLLARYVCVFFFSLLNKVDRKEKILMTFLYPRGLATAVLASIVSVRIPNTLFITQTIFGVIVFTVVISTIGILIHEKKHG